MRRIKCWITGNPNVKTAINGKNLETNNSILLVNSELVDIENRTIITVKGRIIIVNNTPFNKVRHIPSLGYFLLFTSLPFKPSLMASMGGKKITEVVYIKISIKFGNNKNSNLKPNSKNNHNDVKVQNIWLMIKNIRNFFSSRIDLKIFLG